MENNSLSQVIKNLLTNKVRGNRIYGFTGAAFLRLLIILTLTISNLQPIKAEEPTWANWQKKLDRAFSHINNRKIPGRTMGIVVPSDPRLDIFSLSAFGYQVLTNDHLSTVVIMMPAPKDSTVEGLVVPNIPSFETEFGTFNVDTNLAEEFQIDKSFVFVDNSFFGPKIPDLLLNQLAFLRYIMQGKLTKIKVLPVYVHLNDIASQAKDIGPALADKIKDLGIESEVVFVVASNFVESKSESALVQTESQMLTHIRALDVDGLLDDVRSGESVNVTVPTNSTLILATMMMKWLNGDHAEMLAYANSSQLVLTKDKQTILSYGSVAFASGPPYPNRIPHVDREKLVDIYNELFRSDLLTMTRQTCASILDPTAAKPPSLINEQASKKWPVYVSLYDPEGNLGGQAGSHVAVGPLEESVRQFAFAAVQAARPKLTKETFAKYVVDVSIPYGFSSVTKPEDLIPQLNGIIVEHEHKKDAFHPDAWRKYFDPHQLLAAICTKLGLRPWDYATSNASIESFRVLGFNEKEPFQDLGAAARKKKKKKDGEEGTDDTGGDTGGIGGAGGLSF